MPGRSAAWQGRRHCSSQAVALRWHCAAAQSRSSGLFRRQLRSRRQPSSVWPAGALGTSVARRRVQLSRPRKAGGESNDPTQCSSGCKALRALRKRPNLKHKFKYSSLQVKLVSASGKERHAKARPNHFIEGTAKKLRFLSAPHVER